MSLVRKAIRDAVYSALLTGGPTAAGSRVHKVRVLELRPKATPALSVSTRRGRAERFDGPEGSLRLRHEMELVIEIWARDQDGQLLPDLVEDLAEQVLRVVDPLVHGEQPFPSIPELELFTPGCHFSAIEIEYDGEGVEIVAGALMVYSLAYLDRVRGEDVDLEWLDTLGVTYDFPPADSTAEASDEINLDGA